MRIATYALCGVYALLAAVLAMQVLLAPASDGPSPDGLGQAIAQGMVQGLVEGFAVIFGILLAVTVIPAVLMALRGGVLAIPGLVWALLPFALWLGLAMG